MRLSEVLSRIFDAIGEKVGPEDAQRLGFAKGLLQNLVHTYGDIELNIEVRRVPMEVVDAEGSTQG